MCWHALSLDFLRLAVLVSMQHGLQIRLLGIFIQINGLTAGENRVVYTE